MSYPPNNKIMYDSAYLIQVGGRGTRIGMSWFRIPESSRTLETSPDLGMRNHGTRDAIHQNMNTTNTAPRPAHLDRVDAAHRRYTDPLAMLAHLDTFAPLRRLEAALAARETAVHPRGKFGLEAADTAAVVPVLDGMIATLRAALAPLRAFVVELDAAGMASDEIRRDVGLDPRFEGLDVGDVSLGFISGRIRGL